MPKTLPNTTAKPQLRAMILLGINCAFGNHDVSTLPHADDRIRAFGAALHERVGLWIYRLRGWVR